MTSETSTCATCGISKRDALVLTALPNGSLICDDCVAIAADGDASPVDTDPTFTQKVMINALEKALHDARTGRMIAFAFCGVGQNEHAISYAFDDEKPGEQMFLLGVIEKAQGEVRAAVTRYDYELGDDGVMFATAAWQRDNEATAMRLLACHSIEAPVDLVETWNDDQVKAADIWAWSSYLSASDHDDVRVPPRPDFIPDAPDRSHLHPITGVPL